MPHVLALVLPLADSPSPSPSPSNGPNPDLVGPGLLGFISILFLVVAVFFIGRGLNKQLKRVDFDEDVATAQMLGDRAQVAPAATGEASSEETPATSDEAADGGSRAGS